MAAILSTPMGQASAGTSSPETPMQKPSAPTTPPGAASGAQTPDIAGLFVPSADALNQAQAALQASQARQIALAQRVQASIERQNKLAGDLATGTPAIPPAPADLPPLPKAQPDNPASAFTTVMGAFAALAPLFTRRPLINTLTSFSGVIKGYESKRKQEQDYEMKRFDASYKEAMEKHKEQMDQYNAVLNDRKLSVDEKIAQLQAIGNATRDEVMLGQLEQGGVKAVAGLLAERARLGEMLGVAKSRVMMMQSMGGTINPQTIQMLAQEVIDGKPISQVISGYGNMGTAVKLQIQEAVRQELESQGYNAQDAGDLVARASVQLHGAMSAETTAGHRLGAISVALNEVKNMIPIAKPIFDLVNTTNFSDWNALQQYVEVHMGKAGGVLLNNAVTSMRNAYQQALSANGTPTDKARDQAEVVLPKNPSPAQITALFNYLSQKELPALETAAHTTMAITLPSFVGKSQVASPSNAPPVSLLQEGQITTFKNGQEWTLQGGKAVRVK